MIGELRHPGTRTPEQVAIRRWRTGQLQRLGIATSQARAIANEVDWHDVERLVRRGCPPSLAVEIVR